MIMEVEEQEDREEILETTGELRVKWGVGVDEDLLMEERRLRWRIIETAREERTRRRRLRFNNKELWVEGRRWN